MNPTMLMAQAYIVAQHSKCVSWKVGAVIVRDGRIISTGYNGSIAGQTNCCDHAEDSGWMMEHNGHLVLDPKKRMLHSAWSDKHENHAEVNAMIYAARNTGGLEGSTMYVTVTPCFQCAKIIAASGIKRVIYCDEYDRNDGSWSSVLIEAGIEVHKIEKSQVPFIDHSKTKSYQGI